MLIADIRRTASVPTDVIQFNIDSRSEMTGKHNKETIGYVLFKVFNEMQGFCSAILLFADIERNLDKRGLYEAFKEKFEEIYDYAWVDFKDEFDYVQDEVVKVLVEIDAINEEAARNTCEKITLNYSMDTKSFAKLIKNYNERTQMIAEMIFADIYTENKFRSVKFGNRYSFDFKQMVDEKIFKSVGDYAMTVRILTPDSDEATTNDSTMRFLSEQDNIALVVLSQNRAFIDELVTAKQIEKYMQSGASGNLDKYE